MASGNWKGTYGSIFGADFLKVVKPLYDAHMVR